MIAVTVIPALFFLLLELTLRIVGYGFPTSIAIKDKINNVPSYYNNLKFAWRFFHPNIARITEPFAFPVEYIGEDLPYFRNGSFDRGWYAGFAGIDTESGEVVDAE